MQDTFCPIRQEDLINHWAVRGNGITPEHLTHPTVLGLGLGLRLGLGIKLGLGLGQCLGYNGVIPGKYSNLSADR